MKTTIKIMRSVSTSLLFLLITILIMLQFIFTVVRINTRNISDLIDRETLLENILDEKIEDEQIKNLALDYTEDYLNYVFYKRSYPSIQNVDFSPLEESQITPAREYINTLKDKIDLEYETIVKMRNINFFLSNGAIYLIINVGIFFLFIALTLTRGNFKNSFKLFSISLIAAGIITVLAVVIFKINLTHIFGFSLYNMIEEILNESFTKSTYTLTFTYILVGLIIFFSIYFYEYFPKKKRLKS